MADAAPSEPRAGALDSLTDAVPVNLLADLETASAWLAVLIAQTRHGAGWRDRTAVAGRFQGHAARAMSVVRARIAAEAPPPVVGRA